MNESTQMLDKINELQAIMLDVRLRQERIESRLDLLDISGMQKRLAHLEAVHQRTAGNLTFFKTVLGLLAMAIALASGLFAFFSEWSR